MDTPKAAYVRHVNSDKLPDVMVIDDKGDKYCYLIKPYYIDRWTKCMDGIIESTRELTHILTLAWSESCQLPKDITDASAMLEIWALLKI